MPDAVLIIAVAAVAFVSTGLDSLLLLVTWLAAEPTASRSVRRGYVLGATLVLAASWALSRAADLVVTRHIGWLGLVPLAMGIAGLVRWARHAAAPRPARPTAAGVGPALLATVSLGADNLGVFVPLFADTPGSLDPVIAGTIFLGALAWATLAERLARTRPVAGLLERWGPRVVPFLLIAIGTYILLDSPTDVLE